jgi:K+-transporting ATPase c subunit
MDFEALDQLDRVVAARQLGTAAAARVRLLIVELAEPHPNRSVGGARINLMRLNLLLDAVK